MKKYLLILVTIIAACNNGPVKNAGQDKLERNKAVVLRSQGYINSKDFDKFLNKCAPGYREYFNGGPAMADLDSIKTVYGDGFTVFDIRGEDFKAYASGDTVLVTGTWSGKFVRPFHDTAPNNKTFKFDDVDIYVLNSEGRLASHRSTQGSAELFWQLGLLKTASK
ncbi:ester cyclase [Mucilaginibacter pedocola]|uniref:SnoaL-like domain-containing protein n=1 Tax=Mucilaginibacter pedocola TaxID=1792845 RepID=A0A1S9PHI6_9SPHI|nr:ester cyclase [Mucilaginibacter pedocola]OOQ60427.1 hypothetical protein BC343_25785 [Mucilaginibacter pedocola]